MVCAPPYPQSNKPDVAYLPMLFVLQMSHMTGSAGQLKNNEHWQINVNNTVMVPREFSSFCSR